MPSPSESRILDAAADEMSSEEHAALARVPIMCVLRAAGRFVICGPTNPDCQRQFLDDVLECFGARGGGGGGNEGGGGEF